MATLADVYVAIDRWIEEARTQAAGPCIDALLDGADRECYREAIRRACTVRAAKALRAHLIETFGEGDEPAPKPRAARVAKA